jgi:hypothetical protein
MPLRGKSAAAGLPSSPTLARSARGAIQIKNALLLRGRAAKISSAVGCTLDSAGQSEAKVLGQRRPKAGAAIHARTTGRQLSARARW